MRTVASILLLCSLTSFLSSRDFETASPESQGIPSDALRQMSEWVRSEGLDVRSMIVLRNGKLVMEWYAGEVDREMNHNIFSVTKSMVATLAGIALTERQIRGEEATLNDLLGFDGEAGKVTLEDLLTMRSGFPQSRANKATGPERELFDRIDDAPDRLAEVRKLTLVHPPGETFAYSNIDPQLVAAALEKAYGKKLIEIAREKLFRHLKFNGARWVYADETGAVPGGYGLRLRPIDMAKLGQLYLQGGVWEGKQILPTDWVVRAVSDMTGEHYGYFWWADMANDGGKSFAAKGVRGQQILVVPEKKLVFVTTSDLPPERVGEILKTLNFTHLLPVMEDRPLPTNREAEAALAEEMKIASEYVPEHRKGLIPARLPRYPNAGPSPSPEGVPLHAQRKQEASGCPDKTTRNLGETEPKRGKRDPSSLSEPEFLAIHDSFVDWDKTTGIERRLNPPRDIRRVLKPEMPWEALGMIFYCTVVDHEGTAMLYYGCYDKDKKKHLCLATSTDGFQWERPHLGLTGHSGSKENNLFSLEAVEAGVFIDPSTSPGKRFRMLHNRNWPDPGTAGVYLSNSPDGIHWTQNETRLFPFVPDSQPSAFWDESRKQYSIYLRAWDPKRSIARVEVPNIEKPWPYDRGVEPKHVWGKEKIPTPSRELPIVMRPDECDPENVHLYTSNVFQYPWADRTYLAFPAAYFHYKGDQWKDRALDGNDGTFDAQLAVSRDGVQWERFREPWIEPNLIEGLPLQLVSMGRGMIRRGDMLHQYFVGWPYTHNQPAEWDRKPGIREKWTRKDLGGIYCATTQLDRFVALAAGPEGGTLTTIPTVMEGGTITLNIDTSGTGFATVALLDFSGQPLEGFDHTDCVAIHTDEIAHSVQWKGAPTVGRKPVRIQVNLQNAKLFSIRAGG